MHRGAQKAEEILQQVRDLGRWPKENAGRSIGERQLAEKVRRARKAKHFSPEQKADLMAIQLQDMHRDAQKAEDLLQQVRDLGRWPLQRGFPVLDVRA